jgi:uncharacterized protein (DUF2141 family)
MFLALLAVVIISGGVASGDEPSPAPSTPPKVDLLVHAVGFKHTGGHAIARLFTPGDDLMGAGRAAAKANIQGSEATISFPGLAPGPYAVIVCHDENDNGICDHGVLGPIEPIGCSNGFRHGFLSPPTFEKLKFLLGPKSSRIEILVHGH